MLTTKYPGPPLLRVVFQEIYVSIFEMIPGNLSADTSGSLLTLARTSFATSPRYDACRGHPKREKLGEAAEVGASNRQDDTPHFVLVLHMI